MIAEIEAILVEHTLGFAGQCVTVTGVPGCSWRKKPFTDERGGWSDQHRRHVVELIEAVVAS